jgi:hypothetical protein
MSEEAENKNFLNLFGLFGLFGFAVKKLGLI